VSRVVIVVVALEASSVVRSTRALRQSVLSCCEHWPPGASELRWCSLRAT